MMGYRLEAKLEKNRISKPNASTLINFTILIMLPTENFRSWSENVFFPNVGPTSILLIDTGTGHCPEVVQAKPNGNAIIPMIMPKGTTRKFQPLDVYEFRI